MFSTTVIPANTGRVHLGRDVPPTTVVGEPNAGDVLVQGAELSESQSYPDEDIWRGSVWGTASIAGQVVQIEETVKGVK